MASTAAAAPNPLTSPTAASLSERIFTGTMIAAEMHTIYLGVVTGLYAELSRSGPAAAPELAARAGLDARYTREWLEQQAVCGILEADCEPDPDLRRFWLSPDVGEVLVDTESPFFAVGGPLILAGVARALPQLPDAYVEGRGVPYEAYGAPVRRGIAALNRPGFLHELGSVWLPSVPDVHQRLSSSPRGRVLDLGCGVGTSSLAIARSYPSVEVVGVDLDEASIQEARLAARAEGLDDRVSFVCGDAADGVSTEAFDLVTVFEAIHDMGDPVGALRNARSMLTEGGTVLVADDRVADTITAPGDEIERLNYALSVLHCLPATRAEDPVEANGTILRASTMRRWALEAGFTHVDEVEVDSPFWRFYRLAG
jgi:SAM-dependent methyltransferase